MPNWCACELSITGDKAKVKEVKKFIKGDTILDFSTLLPIPSDLLNDQSPPTCSKEESRSRKKKYGYDNWYDWCVYNWGTKWNASDVRICRNTYRFHTAWSPPMEWLKKLSEKFHMLKFKLNCAENGCGLLATVTIQNGCVVSQRAISWDSKEGEILVDRIGCGG
jgi:hypothetical protein